MISSGKIDEIYNKITKSSIKNISKNSLGLSDCVIPFSKLFKNYKSIDIYSGTEAMPFKDRDPDFKMILRQEFQNF